jgi:hypothetical protein
MVQTTTTHIGLPASAITLGVAGTEIPDDATCGAVNQFEVT